MVGVLQISNMKVEREKALEHKQRMSRMMEDKENFVAKITDARSFIYEVKWLSVSPSPYIYVAAVTYGYTKA